MRIKMGCEGLVCVACDERESLLLASPLAENQMNAKSPQKERFALRHNAGNMQPKRDHVHPFSRHFAALKILQCLLCRPRSQFSIFKDRRLVTPALYVVVPDCGGIDRIACCPDVLCASSCLDSGVSDCLRSPIGAKLGGGLRLAWDLVEFGEAQKQF